jgi:hypothetical protein
MKKAAAADAAEFTTEVTKRRGVLGKLGMKKKTKVPVSKEAEEKPLEEEPIMEDTPVQEEAPATKTLSAEEAPAAASSEQLEPEAEKKEDESPMDEEQHDEPAEETVEEREQDEPKEEETATEEPASEEPTPMEDDDAAPVAEDSPVAEEREQPEAFSPLASTGFLCGCMG